jgi:hypothetical protein
LGLRYLTIAIALGGRPKARIIAGQTRLRTAWIDPKSNNPPALPAGCASGW